MHIRDNYESEKLKFNAAQIEIQPNSFACENWDICECRFVFVCVYLFRGVCVCVRESVSSLFWVV